MGVPCHGWNLAGQLVAGVYVFQSLVVACIFGVLGIPVSLVLGTHQVAADRGAVGDFGCVRWTDGKCLLSECDSVDIPGPGIVLPGSCYAARPCPIAIVRSKIAFMLSGIRSGFPLIAITHFHHSLDYLWKRSEEHTSEL